MSSPSFRRALTALAFAALAPELLAQGPAGKLRRFQGKLSTVHLDAATGTITRGPVVRARTAATVSEFPNLDLGGFLGVDTGNGRMEWVNDGLKGTSGNASDLMTSFVMPYCSSKLDPSLGGPGGSVRISFYEGFTRNSYPTPNGTAVAVLTLTGLPANSASSSFFGGFACYSLQVDFADLVPFADGPIGYSWKFLDVGNDGVLAGTWPFLASASSCTSTAGGPPDALGQAPYSCCSVGPADRYRDGQLVVVFTFAPYCIPYSMAIDIREVADTVASAAPYNGDGVNADVLAASPVIVGQTWTAQVTLGHTHGGSGTAAVRVRPSSINGPQFNSPVGGRVAEVLVAGPLLGSFTVAHNGATSTTLSTPIPLSFALVCIPWASQATVTGGGFVDLSSSVTGVTGTQ